MVKAPYSSELAALGDIYAQSLEVDVDPLRRCIHELGSGPAVFVGSGGSMALARLAARLHEEVCRQPAHACTSLEAVDLPQLQRRGLLLLSSSAKHPDAHRVMDDLRRGRFAPAVLVTHRAAEDLTELAGPDTMIASLPALAHRDGFLATGSILQQATMLIRAFMPHADLPKRIEHASPASFATDEVLVLTSPALASVAVDLEVRLVESGLATVQVADYRNFAHGRHTGFARRSERTTVIALSDPASGPLAEGTIGALPDKAAIVRWHVDGSWETAIVTLLARSMHLAGAIGDSEGIDIARPSVPVFGRRLYRLPLGKRVPPRLAGGVERKLIAAGSGDDPQLRKSYRQAGEFWLADLEAQRFGGIVLDYDGTVCWTRRRWELPEPAIQQVLCKLLAGGLAVGFASGRGRSLYDDARKWVPRKHWADVVLGMYNGAVLHRLDEELEDLRLPSAWSRSVVKALDGMAPGPAWEFEQRGAQVSVVGAGVVHQGRLAELIVERLSADGVGAQVVTSGHSVDIIEPATKKTAVIDAITSLRGQMLAIGDQGQLGGNDHHLLGTTPWSLSVDRCSADPQNCWFAGTGKVVGPELLVRYLKMLRSRRDGFSVAGLAIT